MGYSRGMAPENDDAGDFDKLARRYLDLWQSQLAGLASDQALTEQIARLFAAANSPDCQRPASSPRSISCSIQQDWDPRPLPLHLGTALMTWASSEKRLEALEARIAELQSKLGS